MFCGGGREGVDEHKTYIYISYVNWISVKKK